MDDDETISTAELNPLGGVDQPLAVPSESSRSVNVLVPLSTRSRRDLAKQLMERYARSKPGMGTHSGLRADELGLAEPDFQRSDVDGNGSLDFNELMQWLRHPSPAVVVGVGLSKSETAESPIQILESDDKLFARIRVKETDRAVLSIGTQQIEMEIDSASKGDRIVVQVETQTQNLFEILDRNGDRRLSPRELRTAPERIRLGVREGTKDVSLSEIRTPAQLIFRRLPSIADNLPVGEGRPSSNTPEWFPLMDINGDGDLSPREFLGRREQFHELDTDRDGFIDIEEASVWQSAHGRRN